MYVFLTLFFLSAIGLIAMLWQRLAAIESGRIRILGVQPSYFTFAEDVSKIALEHGKRGMLIVVARSLYYFSKALDWVKGGMQRVVVRLEERLARRSSTGRQQGAVSLFLKEVAEHKRVTKIRARRKAREEN